MFIYSSQNCIRIQTIILIQQNASTLYIIDLCTNRIHAIAWINSDYIIYSGFTQHPEKQIDAFITSIPEKDVFRVYTFETCYAFLQKDLLWIRIPVQRSIKRIFIGIQKYGSRARIFISCRGIGLHFQDIFPDQFGYIFKLAHIQLLRRMETALLWACSSSASAMVIMESPMLCSPYLLISWKVIFLKKLSIFTPL